MPGSSQAEHLNSATAEERSPGTPHSPPVTAQWPPPPAGAWPLLLPRSLRLDFHVTAGKNSPAFVPLQRMQAKMYTITTRQTRYSARHKASPKHRFPRNIRHPGAAKSQTKAPIRAGGEGIKGETRPTCSHQRELRLKGHGRQGWGTGNRYQLAACLGVPEAKARTQDREHCCPLSTAPRAARHRVTADRAFGRGPGSGEQQAPAPRRPGLRSGPPG